MKILIVLFISISISLKSIAVNAGNEELANYDCGTSPMQSNGFFTPYIRFAKDKPHLSRPNDGSSKQHTLETEQVEMSNLLSNKITKFPIIFYINANFIKTNQNIYYFRVSKFKKDKDQQFYSVSMLADSASLSYLDARAYWLPQGQSIDIPIRPDEKNDPHFVFTPTFTGCSLAIDQIDDEKFRVYHVQGSKEDKEYNELNTHGRGMFALMNFYDYGYVPEESGTPSRLNNIRNIYGQAFLSYSRQFGKWVLHYQKESYNGLPPTISGFVRQSVNVRLPTKATAEDAIAIQVDKINEIMKLVGDQSNKNKQNAVQYTFDSNIKKWEIEGDQSNTNKQNAVQLIFESNIKKFICM